MTLPASGAITMADYNAELSNAAKSQISMNDTAFRAVTGKTTDKSQVSMKDGWGKSARVKISLPIASDVNNYSVRNSVGSTYVAGKTDVTVTISTGVIVGSSSAGSAAFAISGFTAGDTIKVINNGKIIGAGGDGGHGSDCMQWYQGMSYHQGGNAGGGVGGGTGFYTNFAVTVDNTNGQIAGGGGGGGGGEYTTFYFYWWYYLYIAYYGGSGGSGGAGRVVGNGGAGGNTGWWSGAVGYTGNAGSLTTGGAAVSIGPNTYGIAAPYPGGAGGALGSAGASGYATPNYTWAQNPGPGGAAGSATVGNSNITWTANGTRTGPLN